MKKAILMMIVAIFLVSCSGKNSNSAGKRLTITIWDSNQEPGISQILKDFTAKTGIETVIQVVAWQEYWTMLAAGAQGGSMPDVFWMHSNESQRYMSNDMLLDITSKIQKSDVIQKKNYPDDIWGLYTHNNKNYAIPKDVDTIAMWYNKTMFDEANLPYPTNEWTWNDFFEAAKRLTKDDGSQFGVAIRNDHNQDGYYNMIYANNGYVISDDKKKSGLDDPNTMEALMEFDQWLKAGVMPSLETMSENTPEVLFQSGKVAMVLQGSWMLASYKNNEYTLNNCDIIELPRNAKTGRRVSIYNGLGWAAAAGGKNTEAAWELLEYFGSKEAQLKQAELGITMSAYENTSELWTQSAPFNLQAYINMMDDMEIRPYSRSTLVWETNNSEVLKSVFAGTKNMSDACVEMARFMNNALQDE
ncbi:MAG: ABC transporter substrate-binding protein [Treponemataceae bacterium]